MLSSPKTALPTLGRYEIVAGIASGGAGSVVLARLAGAGAFQRLFAIKILHEQYAHDDSFTDGLLDEARIAARIQHPNVVGIREIVESESHGFCLVMDYVEGVTFLDALKAFGQMPYGPRWRIVIRVMLDALQGLFAAHSLLDDDNRPLNVVHRDVSPQNILIGVDGISRITDFGIAKASGRLATTQVGALKGKLAYLSPEQAQGAKLDARTDVFAAGIVLWEALSGARLFKAASEGETFQRVLNARIPWLREIVPTLPATIDVVCLQGLDRTPERRFASAQQMAAALENAARAYDLVAEPAEVGEWIRTTFAQQLEERRGSIRGAAKDTLVSGELQMLNWASGAGAEEAGGQAAAAPAPVRPSGVRERAAVDDAMDSVKTTHFDASKAPDELRSAIAAFQASLAMPTAPAHEEASQMTRPFLLTRPSLDDLPTQAIESGRSLPPGIPVGPAPASIDDLPTHAIHASHVQIALPRPAGTPMDELQTHAMMSQGPPTGGPLRPTAPSMDEMPTHAMMHGSQPHAPMMPPQPQYPHQQDMPAQSWGPVPPAGAPQWGQPQPGQYAPAQMSEPRPAGSGGKILWVLLGLAIGALGLGGALWLAHMRGIALPHGF